MNKQLDMALNHDLVIILNNDITSICQHVGEDALLELGRQIHYGLAEDTVSAGGVSFSTPWVNQ